MDERSDHSESDRFLAKQNQKVDRETVAKNQETKIGTLKARKVSHSRAVTESTSLSSLGLPLLPSKMEKELDQPDWATPGFRPQDWVKGVRESDRTALSTSEFIFYSYYQRIRDRLDRAWFPLLREKLLAYYHSGRQLASDMDHTTKLLVILNSKGEVVRVQLVEESGTKDLDDAAISAFNQAGPFPNPPQGMIDLKGEVRVPWDFILKT
jgi:TonB family protein